MEIELVDPKDLAHFKAIAEAYWNEMMPKSPMLQDPDRKEANFQYCFAWDGGNRHPHWALVNGEPVGFMAFEVNTRERRAAIHDFYIRPSSRRQGYGTAMVAWLLAELDAHGVEQIDLNVRQDNPPSLAFFWQAQGFGIAGYRLRQLRNPEMGTEMRQRESSRPGGGQ